MPKKKPAKRRNRKPKFTAEELQLAAEGKIRLPKREVGLRELLRIPTYTLKKNTAVEALLSDREGH
jgi:hypothetical protein